MTTREECLALDAADPLRSMRDRFDLDEADRNGLVYLDGNSLGPLPRSTVARVAKVVTEEWGQGLVRSWNSAGWIALADRIGDKIASLIGAGPKEVVVADSTSVNLYKILSAAIALSKNDCPARRRIVSESTNFPSDLYVAETLAHEHGFRLSLVAPDDLADHLDDTTAVLMLTHVNYRTGRMHDLPAVTRLAHDAGILVVWDLCHSAGVVPVGLSGTGQGDDAADFAVGCGYKYLNGGPGSPAFLWVHPRWTTRMDREGWRQPLSGWLGHAAPFDFSSDYVPASGVSRFVCGTPPILSLTALECGVDVTLSSETAGGLEAIRAKSIALTNLFIELVESRCAGKELSIVTPRDPADRGSQVSIAHPDDGYAVMQALIARGVIGDFRAPDLLRFGFAPLYTRYVDVWDAVDRLSEVLSRAEWREPRFTVRTAVT
jgi:kynureninase